MKKLLNLFKQEKRIGYEYLVEKIILTQRQIAPIDWIRSKNLTQEDLERILKPLEKKPQPNILISKLNLVLNHFGQQRWELISSPIQSIDSHNKDVTFTLFFKREI